mgnify:CR=1 FL=1
MKQTFWMASSKSVLQSLSGGNFPGYKNITTARLGKNTERENKRQTNIKHNSENKEQRRKLTKNDNPEKLKLVVRAEYIRNITLATWKPLFLFSFIQRFKRDTKTISICSKLQSS